MRSRIYSKMEILQLTQIFSYRTALKIEFTGIIPISNADLNKNVYAYVQVSLET